MVAGRSRRTSVQYHYQYVGAVARWSLDRRSARQVYVAPRASRRTLPGVRLQLYTVYRVTYSHERCAVRVDVSPAGLRLASPQWTFARYLHLQLLVLTAQ